MELGDNRREFQNLVDLVANNYADGVLFFLRIGGDNQ